MIQPKSQHCCLKRFHTIDQATKFHSLLERMKLEMKEEKKHPRFSKKTKTKKPMRLNGPLLETNFKILVDCDPQQPKAKTESLLNTVQTRNDVFLPNKDRLSATKSCDTISPAKLKTGITKTNITISNSGGGSNKTKEKVLVLKILVLTTKQIPIIIIMNRFWFLSSLFVFVCGASITKLDFSTFGDFVKSSGTRYVFVEFCVSSTTLCQSSMPEFQAVADSIHLPMNVRLATFVHLLCYFCSLFNAFFSVDCKADGQLCRILQVTHHPTYMYRQRDFT